MAVPLPPRVRDEPVKFVAGETGNLAITEPAANKTSDVPDRATAMCCQVHRTGAYEDATKVPRAQRDALVSRDTPRIVTSPPP